MNELQSLAELLRKSRPSCDLSNVDMKKKMAQMNEHLAQMNDPLKPNSKKKRVGRRTRHL